MLRTDERGVDKHEHDKSPEQLRPTGVTRKGTIRGVSVGTSLLMLVLFLGGVTVNATSQERPFDFSDSFYTANGVNPNRIVQRRSGSDGLSVFDESFPRNHRNIRVTITLPAYDTSGHIEFWNLLGELQSEGFTANAAGRDARALANRSSIWVFPKRSGNALATGNSRQADMIDLSGGYFSNNRLGLWVIVFVNYTDRAFNTAEGQQALLDLARRNGLDLDGTPIIRTRSDLDDLTQRGFVSQQIRSADGSQGPTWSLCPVIKDPRGGAIAPDAFLAIVRRIDGTVLPAEREFERQFNCLQTSGDYCH
jgi:hypothetical protein